MVCTNLQTVNCKYNHKEAHITTSFLDQWSFKQIIKNKEEKNEQTSFANATFSFTYDRFSIYMSVIVD